MELQQFRHGPFFFWDGCSTGEYGGEKGGRDGVLWGRGRGYITPDPTWV